MLIKNLEKDRRREWLMWAPYYEHIAANKKAYSRKEKHKTQYALIIFDLETC